MKWLKRGLIYSPQNDCWWKKKYGMMPTPEFIEDENVIRIYFGVTDNYNNGRGTYIDVDADNPGVIINKADTYILNIGVPGSFDDCGAIPSSIIDTDGKKYMYYVGFQRTEKVPYMLFSGLAQSIDEQNFEKYSEAPIIDRSRNNSVSNAAPFVIVENGAFRMWFWLGRQWTSINGKLYIQADICEAVSCDGISWRIKDLPCITVNSKLEFSVGRPWVIKDGYVYKMWYSIRYIDKLYRIGYAESADGSIWIRKDHEAGIDVSENGWDSEMVCYPSVIKVKGRTFMFYNGNNNGETGFGYAELE